MEDHCFKAALKILNRRDYHSSELIKKLKDRDFEDDEIASTIEKVQGFKLIDDDQYICAKIRGWLRRGYARNWIEQKCQSMGMRMSEEHWGLASDEIGVSHRDQLQALIQKKYHRLFPLPDDFKEKQKLMARIVRGLCAKGFRPGEIIEEINRTASNPCQ